MQIPPSSLWLVALLPLLLYCFPSNVRQSKSAPSQQSAVPSDVLTLTRALVAIPSESGSEQAVFTYASTWLKTRNFSIVEQPVEPLTSSHHTRGNLLALHPNANLSDVRVVLSTHLDTVPGHVAIPNVGASDAVADGKLHGRGSVDAKGQAAAMIMAALSLDDKRIAVLLVCGEESDHAGMRNAHKLGFGVVSMINGEPTESKIAIRQKGMIRAKILVEGRAAHSGYPHLGDSAVHNLLDLLQQLRKDTYTRDGETLNVGVVHGGSAANVVADKAEAVLLWRIVTDTASVLQKVTDVVSAFKGAALHVLKMNDAMEFYVPSVVASKVGNTTVAYNTDMPYYQGKLSRVVLFGGGSIHQAHTAKEYIEVEQLEKLPSLYVEIVRELLAVDQPEDPQQ